jgi:hypothetical protein
MKKTDILKKEIKHVDITSFDSTPIIPGPGRRESLVYIAKLF